MQQLCGARSVVLAPVLYTPLWHSSGKIFHIFGVCEIRCRLPSGS